MAMDRRVARTRTALFDALVDLIRERDYGSIRIEDVLARADVGRSTFYAHFKSKDELLERSLERLRAELTAAIAVASAPDLRTVAVAIFRHVDHYRDVHRSLSGNPADEIVLTAIAANFAQVVGAMLPGTSRAPIPRSLAIDHLRGSFLTVLRWWLDRTPPVSADDAAGAFHHLVSRGVTETWPELVATRH